MDNGPEDFTRKVGAKQHLTLRQGHVQQLVIWEDFIRMSALRTQSILQNARPRRNRDGFAGYGGFGHDGCPPSNSTLPPLVRRPVLCGPLSREWRYYSCETALLHKTLQRPA